jgi:hypothetical protein
VWGTSDLAYKYVPDNRRPNNRGNGGRRGGKPQSDNEEEKQPTISGSDNSKEAREPQMEHEKFSKNPRGYPKDTGKSYPKDNKGENNRKPTGGGSHFDRKGNRKNEEKKTVEKVESSTVVPKIPVRAGYIPGAELEEEIPSLPSAKSNTQIPLSPIIEISSNTWNKPESSTIEIPEPLPEILPVDLPSESIPTEDNDSSPLPKPDLIIQKNNSKPSLPLDSISQPNTKEGTVIASHENGSLKDSNEISQTFTFNVRSPLGQEITTGEQTFLFMNGSLYLKISPHTTPLPAWYTSLQEDFENSKNPKISSPKGKNVKKNSETHPEVKNGKLIFPVRAPDIIQDSNFKSDKKSTNVHQKKKII